MVLLGNTVPFNRAAGRSLFLLLIIWAPTRSLAQDALRNAMSVDTVLNQPQNPPAELQPDRPHLGPVQLACGLLAGVEFNDNINASQFDPQSDVLTRGGVSLSLSWPATDKSDLQFGTGLGYIHYARHPQYSGLEVTPNSALTWQVGFTDGTLLLYDQFSYVQQVTQEASVANLTTLPRLDNTIGARVDWEPGHETLQVSYGHNTFLSTDSAYQYLDRSSEYFFARAGWRFAENTHAGIESSASFTTYDQAIQSDNQNYSIGPYVDWQLTQNLHLECHAGPTLYQFTSVGVAGPLPDLHTYYANLSVNHTLTQFFSHQLSLRRDVSPGLNIGSDYVEQFTADYSISLALTPHITLGGHFAYEQGNQSLLVPYAPIPGLQVIEKEDFDRYGLGASIAWSLTDHLSANLRYDFWQRHSSLDGLSYSQHSVSLQLVYNF